MESRFSKKLTPVIKESITNLHDISCKSSSEAHMVESDCFSGHGWQNLDFLHATSILALSTSHSGPAADAPAPAAATEVAPEASSCP